LKYLYDENLQLIPFHDGLHVEVAKQTPYYYGIFCLPLPRNIEAQLSNDYHVGVTMHATRQPPLTLPIHVKEWVEGAPVRQAQDAVSLITANNPQLEAAPQASQPPDKLANHKLIFEIDERNTVIKVQETNSAIRIFANIQLRFENRSAHSLSLKGLDMSLHRNGIVNKRSAADIFTLFAILRVSRNGEQINKEELEGLTFDGHQLSPFYLFEAMLGIDDEKVKTAQDLDPVHYLRITMQASGGEPKFTADLYAHWQGALKEKGTSQIHVLGAPSISKDYRRID
jgi:hypothetical protein